MCKQKIALIGHSGSGKSSCLIALGIPQELAEMDQGPIGTKVSPSVEVSLDWIEKTKQPVVVVGVHRELLKSLGDRIDEIRLSHPGIRFVYLRKPKAELEINLHQKAAEGHDRPKNQIDDVLKDYDENDGLFGRIADWVICGPGESSEQIAERLRKAL
jgi:hypothetical protein